MQRPRLVCACAHCLIPKINEIVLTKIASNAKVRSSAIAGPRYLIDFATLKNINELIIRSTEND